MKRLRAKIAFVFWALIAAPFLSLIALGIVGGSDAFALVLLLVLPACLTFAVGERLRLSRWLVIPLCLVSGFAWITVYLVAVVIALGAFD